MKNCEVLLSIKPKWCELIANGKKIVEVRKTRPKLGEPFKVYIYETKDKNFESICTYSKVTGVYFTHRIGKVIGEFICSCITNIRADNIIQAYYQNQETCLTDYELMEYANGRKLYYWRIFNLVIYDKPKELSEFRLKRPPQSWCYVSEEKHD